VLSYDVTSRLPYIMVTVGADSLRMNLDTGAAEWMTIPPRLQSRLRWATSPVAGRVLSNNQTGRARVLEGTLADTLRAGMFVVPSPLVFVNADADEAWFGMSALGSAEWTFDTQRRRVRITPAVRR
jgi:hypothetical protein